YTLVGRGRPDPLAANARSFVWSAPLAIALVVLVIATHGDAPPSARGVALALVSGAVTSGLGYAIWYRALPSLTVTQAAVAQLSVPVIAALGAVAVLGEEGSSRRVVAACRDVDAVISTATAMGSKDRSLSLNDIDRKGQLRLVDVARQSGVHTFVYLSLSPNLRPRAPLVRYKREVERAIRLSGMRWT